MAESTVLAYLAGIVDADGYITIQRSLRNGRPYYGPKVGIAGTRRAPHDLAASVWGGTVNLYPNGDHRPQYLWSRYGRPAVLVISDLTPYLRVKQMQARIALHLGEDQEWGRVDCPFPWMTPDYSPTGSYQTLFEDMVALNQSRSRGGRTPKANGRELDGRVWDEMPG